MSGTLYCAATPIGNLSDMSLRAIDVMKSADLIIAEDTRQTKKLLIHFDIDTKIESYHKFNEVSKSSRIIDRLKSGENIVLVSDAGTPAVSDPGSVVVREAQSQGIRVVPVPGPSALTALLSVVGLEYSSITFVGFLPRKHGEITALFSQFSDNRLVVFFESPRRIAKSLESIKTVLPLSEVVVGRELTKQYETIYRFKLSEFVSSDYDNLKGECVAAILVKREDDTASITDALNELMSTIEKGAPVKQIAKQLAPMLNISVTAAYDLIVAIKKR